MATATIYFVTWSCAPHWPQAESVEHTQELATSGQDGDPLNDTLICFVLVDPNSRHAFCSRYDFGPWPLLQGITSLPEHSLKVWLCERGWKQPLVPELAHTYATMYGGAFTHSNSSYFVFIPQRLRHAYAVIANPKP